MKKSTGYESWVSSFIARLSDHFNLAGWQYTIEYEDQIEPSRDGEVYAKIHCDAVYLRFHVVMHPAAKDDFEKGNLDRLVHGLVHEMSHIFLSPFDDVVKPHLSPATEQFYWNIVEQQTQKLTMVFLKTLPKTLIPS